MISKLTPEQESQIPAQVKKWLDNASTNNNREAMADAIKRMYAAMGEDEPIVVFGESPIQAIIMKSIMSLKDSDELDLQLRSQLHSQLSSPLHSQLRSQLSSQPRSQLRSQLESQLRSQLSSQLDSQLYSQLRSQLDLQLDLQLESQLYSQLDSKLHSQLDLQLDSQLGKHDRYTNIWWGSVAAYFEYAQGIGVQFDKEKLDLFVDFNKYVTFTIPYKGIVFASDKPTRVVWENGLLSWDNGKAVEYADGWGFYSLDGVGFTEEEHRKITSQEMTLEELAGAKMGADKSAVAIKYLRPDRLLEQVKAELIDTGKPKYNTYTAMRMWLKDSGYDVNDKGLIPRELIDVYAEAHRDKLYKVPNFLDSGETEYCMRMMHPSNKTEYIEWVEPSVGEKASVEHCQAVAFGMTDKEWAEAVAA